MSALTKRIAKRLAQSEYGWRKEPKRIQWYVGTTEHADCYYATLAIKVRGELRYVATSYMGGDEDVGEEGIESCDKFVRLEDEPNEELANPCEYFNVSLDWLPRFEQRAQKLLAGEDPADGPLRPNEPTNCQSSGPTACAR